MAERLRHPLGIVLYPDASARPTADLARQAHVIGPVHDAREFRIVEFLDELI